VREDLLDFQKREHKPKSMNNYFSSLFNSFLTKLDDKSGYDNVLMSENSKSLLGFQWAGHYFQYNTLPFGWKNSALFLAF
jgi:hypothetical protein